MSYSRRQLYAFGEPLGNSVTRKEGGRVVYGDGGGSSQPTSSTSVSELPEWAKGYAKDTLAKTGALTDINQNPYKPYEGNRIAGFSPLQQQAQQQATGMQTSGLTGLGGQLAGAATMGALGTRYDPSTFQAGFTPTEFQGGQFGQQDAQQYMSPYMQSVVDIQQREAQRQGDIAGTQRNAQAVRSGAFGGSRQAIMDAEAARNLATQKGDIQAQGLQSAYQQAQSQFNADQARRMQAQQFGEQSRQFGSNLGMQAQQLGEQSKQYGAGLGLQGLQTALQGAGQMGTLGGQQFAQGMDINKLQNAYGGQQQALQQQGLSQAYQDFQNQQNYPYKQLGFMSDMIRGLPLGQQSTRQLYEPEPGMGSQLVGLGTAAAGLSKFMAEGGVTGDANVSNILSKLSDAQLEQAKQSAIEREDINQVNMIVAEQQERAQTRSGISAAAPAPGGIASAASDEMMDRMLPTEEGMARGGIVAFSDGGTMSGFEPSPEYVEAMDKNVDERSRAKVIDALEKKVAFLDTAAPEQAASVRAQLEAFKASGATALPSPAAPAESAAEPAASSAGLGGTREAKRAPAVLPPDIGAGRERPAATAGGAPTGGRDLMQVQEDIYSRMKRLDKGDPYAKDIKELGDLNIREKEGEKATLLEDQAKSAKAYDERDKRLVARKADIAKREDKNLGLALISAGFTTMATPGGLAKAIGAGAKVGTEKFASGLEKIQTAKDLLEKATDDLEDLRLNRSDMSAKEIRLANSNISAARIKAKELTIAGLKEAGAKTDAKANAIVEATFRQMQSREANAAADRRAAAAADKPSETERMMKDIGAIASGKASYAGKTGTEGVQLYKENRAAVSGVRYEGQKKAASYSPGDTQLVKGLADQVALLAGSSDPKNVAKVKVLEDKIAAVDRKYAGAGSAGGASGKPSQEVFMAAARKANPGASDAELEAYYADKYK